MATKTALRKEHHEFGPFSVDVSECENGTIGVEAYLLGTLVAFHRRTESFDEVKATTKEILIDAARRYQWAAQNWDCTQTSTHQ